MLQSTISINDHLISSSERVRLRNHDVAAVRQWCREQSPEFFADGIRQLVRRWQLCVDRDGDYVEKINMRCVAEVSSFNLMYNLCMYYEKQKCYDKTELTFQPTLVYIYIYIYIDLVFSFCNIK